MAAQAALIADTIIGMKRARRREDHESGPDDPITQPTNRGNKLRANARFVREGALGYINPGDYYKQKVEHAGYTRYTLKPNPPRYDSEGDELDEDDEDSEADAAAAEENPFSDIALENLLCPLKHPSELPDHPSMSHPYTSKALWDMTQAIEAKLRQERVLLWRARNLHRQFLGDTNWIPCGAVETPEDRFIFQPRTPETHDVVMDQYHPDQQSPTGAQGVQSDKAQELPSAADIKEPQEVREGQANQTAENDIEMVDAQNHASGMVEADKNGEQDLRPKPEDGDREVGDALPHPKKDSSGQGNDGDAANQQNDQNQPTKEAEAAHRSGPELPDGQENANEEITRTDSKHGSETQEEEPEKDAEMQDASSPEPPRRMTTRAKANAENPQEGETANHFLSPPSDTLSTLPPPHPIFLVPDAIRPDPNFGLPPNEAEETRRLLWSYVQKQEETVRGFEHMLDSLLRACRMKDDVFEWCKAEGHLDEMSDGEDWYDREKWGLTEGEELKKGADEDDMETVDDSRATGKRGRGRRA